MRTVGGKKYVGEEPRNKRESKFKFNINDEALNIYPKSIESLMRSYCMRKLVPSVPPEPKGTIFMFTMLCIIFIKMYIIL